MKFFLHTAMMAALPLISAQPQPAVQTFTLPNGLRVLLLEDHATPLLRATLRVAWKLPEVPTGKEGLGLFLGMLLERTGPGFQSRSAFDRSMAASGVRLGFHPCPGKMDWSASAHSADQEAALQAIAQLVMRPGMEGPTVEALRLSTWRALEATAPAEMVRQRFLASLQQFTPLEEAALGNLGLSDLETFRNQVIRPERAVLGLTGDLNLAQAKSLALLHLGAWGPASQPAPPLGAPSPSILSHPEGAPEAWLGASLPTDSAKAQAASELLSRMLAELPDTPLLRAEDGSPYLLAREAVSHLEALPSGVQALRTRFGMLSASLTQEAFGLARKRWLQEEALLPLNPGRQLDQELDRSLGRAPRAADIQAVSLEEVRTALEASLSSAHLLLLGVPKGTLALWLKESPALAPWAAAPQASTATPKRVAKSR